MYLCVCICVREKVSVCAFVQNTNTKLVRSRQVCSCACVCECVRMLFLKERKHGTSIMLPSGTLAYSGILRFKSLSLSLSSSVRKVTFACETKHKSRKIRTV